MVVKEKGFTHNTKAISQKAFDEHMKLYKGYVEKVNSITRELLENGQRPKSNATQSHYRGLKKGETYALDGVILHEMYFQNMTASQNPLNNEMKDFFKESFGSYENWKDDFVACGKSARGWVILCFEQRSKTYRNILLDLHNEGLVCGILPLIVMDMYEHAYFIDYGTDKEEYIQKFITSIDWDVLEKRLKVLTK